MNLQVGIAECNNVNDGVGVWLLLHLQDTHLLLREHGLVYTIYSMAFEVGDHVELLTDLYEKRA